MEFVECEDLKGGVSGVVEEFARVFGGVATYSGSRKLGYRFQKEGGCVQSCLLEESTLFSILNQRPTYTATFLLSFPSSTPSIKYL